jgi:hypothetical protein
MKRVNACIGCLVKAIFLVYLLVSIWFFILALWRLIRACLDGWRRPSPVDDQQIRWAFRERTVDLQQ